MPCECRLGVDTIIFIEYSISQEYLDVMIPRLQSGHLGAVEQVVKPAVYVAGFFVAERGLGSEDR